MAESPALTIAVALAAGMAAQVLARHLRVPGIVLLLGAGIVLGPDVLGVVRPDGLGDALHHIVGFAVAVILFEGALSLDWRKLAREGVVIRRLVSVGALVTAVGGTLAARFVLGWPWRLCILFGTLVIVTGPTVISPLLRRIKVRHQLETILMAESVLIDAVGAVVAVVTLEVILTPGAETLLHGAAGLLWRLLGGSAMGAAGGLAIALLLRHRRVIPDGLENVFTLALALALFQASNAVMEESGIVSVVVAGIVAGNARIPVKQDLVEFKEQLTVLMIGMLFVLLAADVRHDEAVALGQPGLLVVMMLMFLVRPLGVLVSSWGTGLTWRDKAFLSWLAPRGIVAAAVASLFDDRLVDAGYAGGQDMRALVFLVIAVTVTFQGVTGGWVARWLGLRRPSGVGYAILGGHALARLVARVLSRGGEEVVLVDANPDVCRNASDSGFRVICGSGLEERVLLNAEVESRRAVVGLLTNDAVNLLFARKAMTEYGVPRAFIGVQRGHGGIDNAMAWKVGVAVLFGGEVDLELWAVRVRRGLAVEEVWRLESEPEETTDDPAGALRIPKEMQNLLLPVACQRDSLLEPVGDKTDLRENDRIIWIIFDERGKEARSWLERSGWRREGIVPPGE